MLIVADDGFLGAMQPFVQWKRQRGVPVELITTSSVGGTTSGIKAAIQQRYDSADGLAFVILVGDGEQVPHYSGASEGADDDTRYVRLDGNDVYPDVLISRISAQNATQVAVQVEKFVTYERDVAGLVRVLRGADPELAGEYVLLSAHYDHVGIGQPDQNQDSIYNGARDNALGVAALLAAAETLARKPPSRSVIFLAVTAEEKGLLGSRY